MINGLKNEPYVAVIYASFDPKGYAKTAWWWNYIAPVEKVRITLNISGKKIASVKTLSGSAFTMKRNGKGVELLLPRMEAYEGILIKVE